MQINRLFEIVYILLNKKIVTARELSKHFEVCTRTIYRDIETLSAANIPLYMRKGNGGGISLLPEFVLSKAALTEDEKNKIMTSLKALNLFNPDSSKIALKKLNNFFGITNSDWLEIDFSSWTNCNDEKQCFCLLKNAVIKKNIVKFMCYSGKGENTERCVEPLKLCLKSQAWYLYGFCRIRNDYRFFKLSRIRKLIVLSEIFKRTAPNEIFIYDNMIVDEYVNVTLKLDSDLAFRVYDEFESYKQLSDGSFIVELMLPKNEYLFDYILSFGEKCEVLVPKEVRDDVIAKVESILKNYKSF